MSPCASSRRRFLADAGLAAGAAALLGPRLARAAEAAGLHLSSNSYSWHVYYQREKKNFGADLDAGCADIAKSGLNGLEPGIGGPADIERHAAILKKHGLEMRSIYMGSCLHLPDKAEQSIARILAVAAKAKEAGTRILVTNPDPNPNKTDDQLKVQAESLGTLGKKLAELGVTLAYHNHDVEMRKDAKEFHSVLDGTDPKLVTLCLDAHWVWRGSGNSAAVLDAVVKKHGARVSELHLRQSVNKVWLETFGEGDIDYPAMVKALAEFQVKPLLVMEIAVEKGTPNTMDAVEAHRKSAEYARKVFAEMG
jgi:inosose dehydratase